MDEAAKGQGHHYGWVPGIQDTLEAGNMVLCHHRGEDHSARGHAPGTEGTQAGSMTPCCLESEGHSSRSWAERWDCNGCTSWGDPCRIWEWECS